MTKISNYTNCDDNSCYTDGFPVNDNPEKKDDIHSRDPSRPFDSGRPSNSDPKKKKHYNHTGTTLDEPDKYKK